jgi:hypothetical protein
MDPDPDPGGPKTYGSGSRSATVVFDMIVKYVFLPGGAETGGSRQPCHCLSAGLLRPWHAYDSRLCPRLSAVAGKNYLLLVASVVDPWHFGTDPDPAIFVCDLQDDSKNFFYFLKQRLHHFSKIKSHKEVTK